MHSHIWLWGKHLLNKTFQRSIFSIWQLKNVLFVMSACLQYLPVYNMCPCIIHTLVFNQIFQKKKFSQQNVIQAYIFISNSSHAAFLSWFACLSQGIFSKFSLLFHHNLTKHSKTPNSHSAAQFPFCSANWLILSFSDTV